MTSLLPSRGSSALFTVTFILGSLVFASCTKTAPPTVLLRVEAGAALPPIDHLRLNLYGTKGWDVHDRRLPREGRASLPNEVVLYPPQGTTLLRIDLRARDGSARTLGEGTGQVTLREGSQVRITIRVDAGKRPDRDRDGVPDAIDNCPDEANPDQTPCATSDGGPTDGRRDGRPHDGAPRDLDSLPVDIQVPDTGPPLPSPSQVVTADGWGLRHPIYPDTDFRAIHGSSPTNIWVVGADGLAMRFNGKQWTIYPTGIDIGINAVWTPGPNEAWLAADNGTILHFAKGSWHSTKSGTIVRLTGIWGAAPNDVWVVGIGRTYLHWDGTGWTRLSEPPNVDANAIAGLSSQAIWAAGRASYKSQGIAVYNGATWKNCLKTVTGYAPRSPLASVFPLTPGEVWAAGSRGLILHATGASIWEGTQVSSGSDFNGIWASGPKDIWAVSNKGEVFHQDGSAWTSTQLASTPRLNGIWGSSEKDIWVVGDDNALWHYDGSTWKGPPPLLTTSRLYAAWRAASGALFVVGDGGQVLLRSAAGSWSKESVGETSSLRGIWGSSLSNIWIVSAKGKIFRRDVASTSGWKVVASAGTTTTLHAIDGRSASNIWAVGGRHTTSSTGVTTWQGHISHFDGQRWLQSLEGERELHGLWAGPKITWVVGDRIVMAREAGQATWTHFGNTNTPDLRAVWGDGAGTIWAVGLGGASFRFDGANASLTPIQGAEPSDLFALRGISGPGTTPHLWAAGDDGIFVLDKGAWRNVGLGPPTQAMRGIAAGAPKDVWVVGDRGTVLHFDDRP